MNDENGVILKLRESLRSSRFVGELGSMTQFLVHSLRPFITSLLLPEMNAPGIVPEGLMLDVSESLLVSSHQGSLLEEIGGVTNVSVDPLNGLAAFGPD